jgi:hypothetical protein
LGALLASSAEANENGGPKTAASKSVKTKSCLHPCLVPSAKRAKADEASAEDGKGCGLGNRRRRYCRGGNRDAV